MARFILDVSFADAPTKENIKEVLQLIERDDFLAGNVASIRCIDETYENQFWSHDCFNSPNAPYEEVIISPMMNVLSEKQIENDRKILSKH